MMNKIALVSALAAGTLVMTACSGGDGADETTTWRLGHSYGPESLENRSAERLADNIEKASDGKITVEIFPSSQLGSWEEMQEQMEVGSVDIVIESIGSLERYSDLAGIEGVPFIYEDADHYFRTWDSDLGTEMMQAIKEDSGFFLTGAIYRGPRVLNSTEPINSLADAEGLKIRVPKPGDLHPDLAGPGHRAHPTLLQRGVLRPGAGRHRGPGKPGQRGAVQLLL